MLEKERHFDEETVRHNEEVQTLKDIHTQEFKLLDNKLKEMEAIVAKKVKIE
jgi:hypothetical protein